MFLEIINVRNYKRFDLEGFQSDVKTIPKEHIKLVSNDANESVAKVESILFGYTK